MSKENEFGALRLKKDTIELLKQLKHAYEISFDKNYTNDDFIKTLADSVKISDNNTWNIFITIVSQQSELKKKAQQLKDNSISDI